MPYYARLRVSVILVAALLTSLSHAEPEMAETELTPRDLIRISVGRFYNSAAREFELMGGQSVLQDVAMREQLVNTLEVCSPDNDCRVLMSTIAFLRLPGFEEALRHVASHGPTPYYRVHATTSIAIVNPDSEFPQEWLNSLPAAEYLSWGTTNQVRHLDVVAVLPIRNVSAQARSIAEWLSTEISKLDYNSDQAMGLYQVRSSAERLEREANGLAWLMQPAEEGLVRRIADTIMKYRMGWRVAMVSQAISRNGITEEVASEIRSRLPDRLSDPLTEEEKGLLLMIDRVRGRLSVDELRSLGRVSAEMQ